MFDNNNSFTHPHVILNLFDFLLWNTKLKHTFKVNSKHENSIISFLCFILTVLESNNSSVWGTKRHLSHLLTENLKSQVWIVVQFFYFHAWKITYWKFLKISLKKRVSIWNIVELYELDLIFSQIPFSFYSTNSIYSVLMFLDSIFMVYIEF